MERAQERPSGQPAGGREPEPVDLELLVHGVGGTTPEEMLGEARTVRVAGDDTAAVFRRAEDVSEDVSGAGAGPRGGPGARGGGGPVQEAYVWCNLTSGDAGRALWLLLLPFMVVNLAHWMRPAAPARPRAVRLYGLLVRLIALTLTVLLVAAACEVALDLVAWQCAGARGCARRHFWLAFLTPDAAQGPGVRRWAELLGTSGGWWAQPGRRLALAALVPGGLILLLWYLSHRTWSAYESHRPLVQGPDPAPDPDDSALARPGFWYGRRLVARLRAAHTAAGLLTIAAALATPALRFDHRPGGPGALDILGRLLTACLLAGAGVTVAAVCRRGRDEHRVDQRLDPHLLRQLPLGALTLLLLTALYTGWSRPDWHSTGRLPGAPAFGGLMLAQGVLVVVLGVVARGMYRSGATPSAPTNETDIGSSSVPGPTSALGPASGPVPGIGSGPASDPALGPRPGFGPGSGPVLGIGSGPVSGPDLGRCPGFSPGSASGVGSGPERGRDPGPAPGPGPGSGLDLDGDRDRERVPDLGPSTGPCSRLSRDPDLGHGSDSDPDLALDLSAGPGPGTNPCPTPHPRPTPSTQGLGGPAAALVGCVLGGVMSGGVAQRVADWLDGAGGAISGPSVVLTWQASMIPPLLAVLLGVAVRLAAGTARLARAERDRVRREHPGEPEDPARTRAIAHARAMAALTDRAPLVLTVLAAAALVLGGVALAGALVSGRSPDGAAGGTAAVVRIAAGISQGLGSWLVGLGFLLFVTWGRRAYKDRGARRTVGILWDVGTFWPRAAHPFAPPCYAERAVPDLTWRMATWTEATGGRLVLSGHSQGSVLAAAAAWQLTPAARARIALLTYGSPLERLYGRWFPAHFGPAALAGLHRDMACWHNLYRRTDPIGGPVRLPADGQPLVDRPPLRDPLTYGRTPEHPLPTPILGHSCYRSDPAFAQVRADLLTRLHTELPAPRGESAT
ncbi:hypothetical protein [Streptomyces sp. CRPSP2-6A1]|uniref:hypothetical protein n=1 Tax=Streptomyces sp. CRPSP2-6A1 TaxID=2799588 RepID=UPI0035AC1538